MISEEKLIKVDPEVADLLQRIRSGQARSTDADAIERHLYQDTMVPGARNKSAYHDFLNDGHANSGVHASVDLNALGKINKLHTEIQGDRAIRDLGDVLHRTSAKYGGRLFRNGGDEFSLHFLEPEHAHRFARDFEKEMDDYHKVHGAIGGTHRLGASIGIGYNREHAGQALITAKKKLYDQDEFGNRTPKHDFKDMPSSIHSALHESTPPGWKTAESAIADKKKNLGHGQDIQSESEHPSAAPTSFHFPGTMSMAGSPGTSVHYTSIPHQYQYVTTPLSNPLQKSDDGPGEHPAISGTSAVGTVSAENPRYPVKTPGGTKALMAELGSRGIPHELVAGKYGVPEAWILAHGIDAKTLGDLGHRYGQECVVHSEGGHHALLYTNGPKKDHFHPGHGIRVSETAPDDNFTVVPSQGKNFYLSHDTDTDTLLPLRMYGRGGAHPHAYPWHEGHTGHHGDDLKKAENEQAGGVGASGVHDYLGQYGTLTPGTTTNLNHYDFRSFEPQIDALAKKHGYEFKLFGGKYGPMDLGKENYNVGKIGIYDPTPGSGGDSGEEGRTRSWRKLHELSHALTYKDLNDKYGEGRRIGKLGVHRTPREARRAVEWEHHAVLKQRQLGEQLGHHIPDPVFAKEYNTVMGDAVARAVHGKFLEPSAEGFSPHSQMIPLEHSLGLVQRAADQMGLGDDETLKTKARAVVKSELLKAVFKFST